MRQMRSNRLAAGLSAAVLTGAALLGTVAAAAGAGALTASGIIPPKNPARSLPPAPFSPGSGPCTGGNDGAACNGLAVRAVDRARTMLEHIPGLSFSLGAYRKMTPAEQLFVTVNLERTERGLRPVWELSRSLDAVAQAGANDDTDPPLNQVPDPLPGGGHWSSLGGNWAGGWINALGADYAWMYDDGGSGWGHRDNILGSYAGQAACGGGPSVIAMGAGHVTSGRAYGDSETELVAGVCGPAPTDAVLTWNQARKRLGITG